MEVKAERPVFDVVNVERAALLKGDVATAGDLSETGEAGFDRKEERAVTISLKFPGDESARTNEGDVATNDVPELREFV